MVELVQKSKTLNYNTKHRLQFINITREVEDFINKSGVTSGIVVIQTHHTTCGLWVNEDEKNLVGSEGELGYDSDMKIVLDKFASPKGKYNHDDVCDIKNPKGKRNTNLCAPNADGTISECRNGFAHAQNMILQSSVSLIIEKKKLLLGKWQRILLVELDHDRERKVTMIAQGT